MRMHEASLRFGLIIAALVVLAMASPESMVAQVLPLPASQTGSVTGVVRTTGGTPASGIRVTATRVDSTDDKLRSMSSLTQTDSTGRYRLENVPAGRYYITAGRVDLPTYYPGTLDMTKSTVISISSLAAVSDIDFVIQDTSATLPAAAGVPGLRSGGPGGAPGGNLPLLGNLPFTVGLTFQGQNGGAPRSAVPGGRGAGRTGGPAPGGNINLNGTQANAAWWTNVGLVARLGLTDDQKKKIEATFEQYRQTLVQNKADLEKEEAGLARMLEAEPLEPAKTVTTQIERVVQARAEMERTNSKMTLEMRQNLTRSQWVQLQTETALPGPALLQLLNTLPAGRGGRNTTPGGPAATPGTPSGR